MTHSKNRKHFLVAIGSYLISLELLTYRKKVDHNFALPNFCQDRESQPTCVGLFLLKTTLNNKKRNKIFQAFFSEFQKSSEMRKAPSKKAEYDLRCQSSSE